MDNNTVDTTKRSVNAETLLSVIIQQRNQATDELAKFIALVQELEQENSRLKEQLARE